MLYLASPYSHPDPVVRARRAELARRATAILMEKGYHVFSPIAHSVAVEAYLSHKQPHKFWMSQCYAMLRRCERLVVLRIDGWEQSKGVRLEIKAARSIEMPVDYFDLPPETRL